ncbi:hypothetical protein T01_4440 [Trichinella spiralis]|uniref:Uncharacterized protein n=1 Tax=Trichinella spiralis TaxID=6334 RepID=A0A0V1AJ65_TRISP|nr:hypothetical protein T01_4440 [Trichinella spiralis]
MNVLTTINLNCMSYRFWMKSSKYKYSARMSNKLCNSYAVKEMQCYLLH